MNQKVVFIVYNSHKCHRFFKVLAKKCVSEKIDICVLHMSDTYSTNEKENLIFKDLISADCIVIITENNKLYQSLINILQALEISSRVIICTLQSNRISKTNNYIDTKLLSERLQVPAISINKKNINIVNIVCDHILSICYGDVPCGYNIRYPAVMEAEISEIAKKLKPLTDEKTARWMAIRLLEGNILSIKQICKFLSIDYCYIAETIHNARKGIIFEYPAGSISDIIQKCYLMTAEDIYGDIQKIKTIT